MAGGVGKGGERPKELICKVRVTEPTSFSPCETTLTTSQSAPTASLSTTAARRFAKILSSACSSFQVVCLQAPAQAQIALRQREEAEPSEQTDRRMDFYDFYDVLWISMVFDDVQ